ncbi:MAG: corrinoid protein [Deltaproteobacteria bacterium]|nr:corrinoid protein [Deltaproteobacteria bacterium]
MADFNKIAQAVVKGSEAEVRQLTQAAIDEGTQTDEIIYDGLIKGMNIIGEKWRAGEYFIPEVLIAARAMKIGMGLIIPLPGKEIKSIGTIVMGTVQGDIHDIGKNLVILMMEAAGFKVVDLGTNVEKEAFVKSAKDNQASLVGLSALLTTTMGNMEEVISEFEESGIRSHVRIMVGGAPINQEFADSIRADAYAENASFAVEKAKELLGTN